MIERHQKRKDLDKFKEACKIIEGIDINDVLNQLYLERKKDDLISFRKSKL